MGIDTEYVREGEIDETIPDDVPGNYVLSYQAWVLDTDTGKQDGAVIHTGGSSKRFRLSLTGFLSRVLDASFKAGIISDIPERIIVAAHFTRADLCGFSDWVKLKWQIDAVRGTFATTKKPIVRHLRINNRPRKISITIVDTMLLAPTGQQSLSALGDMLEVAKVTLPTGSIERMDLLRETNPVLFDRYALRDAEIAALWVQKVLDFFRLSLEIDGVRIPATLGSAGVRTFKQQFDKGELDTLLGYEIITNGRFKNRVPIAVIADHFSFFADCYHGGRNEAYTVGYSDVGDIIDIDLAGAYTTAMAGIQTPDWEKTIVTIEILQLAKVDVLSVARVNFKFPDNIRFPSLPVRAGERGLIYPQSGTSYCTGAELVVALEQGAIINVEHGVVVPYADDQRPFAKFTTTINDIRKAHPKGSIFERMAKEIGNSLYGKTAQGVETIKARSDTVSGRRVFSTETGQMTTLPPSAITQPILAAFTTGLVRAVLSEIIGKIPNKRVVYSATTDGFLSNVTLDEIDLTGPATRYFSKLRLVVSDSPNVIEEKHHISQVIVIKTRGTISTKPANENAPGKPVLARAGQRLETRYSDPWEECREWERKIKDRNFDTAGSHSQLIPLRPQWLQNADLTSFERISRINLCYDLKRRPINIRDKGGIIAFETIPWGNVGEFTAYRDAFDQWRKDNKRTLKHSSDWFDFVQWNEARPGRRAAGVRGDRPRIVTLFMRAYARGEMGFPGKDFADAAAFVTDTGWPTTSSNIKDAKRRGRLEFNTISKFTEDEIAFMKLVSKRWPQSSLKKHLKR